MSDYIMVSSPTVQSDLVTKTDYVVYIPLATKDTYGSVKVGEGLKIDYGVVSLDSSLLEDKLDTNLGVENANKFLYVNENGFIDLKYAEQIQYASKNDFKEIGNDKLIYVDLSDNSLWIYKEGEYVSASSVLKVLGDWLSTDGHVEPQPVNTLKFGSDFSVSVPTNGESTISLSPLFWLDKFNKKLDKNTTVTSTPQIYAKNTDGTQTMLNAVQYYSDDRNGIARYINGNLIVDSPTEDGHASTKKYVDDKFNGSIKPYTYDTYHEMITALNAMSATDINRGQDIMIVQTGVPDVWVAYVEETSVPYTYVDDETFVDELLTNGTVQVGYYKLGYLETQKIDLTEYVKIEQLNEKQDKLIAGENITIDENNVISATGGLNIADLPKFTNKLYIDMSLQSSLAGVWTMPIYESGDMVIDWGDGSITEYSAGTIEISHTYSDANFSGWVYIYGDWQGPKMGDISLRAPEKLVITDVVLDNNITHLKRQTFWGAENIKSIKLPSNLKIIDVLALYKVYLGNTTIPNSVYTIESSALYIENINTLPHDIATLNRNLFYGYDYSKIIIPQSVVTINDSLFGYSRIETVVFDKKLPSTISSATFNDMQYLKQIIVPTRYLKTAKTATNLTNYADKIYPEGGNYSETIAISASSWDTSTNTVTVEAVGATSEDRNIITWNVSSGGVQVENTYGLKCTAQGTMSLTFSCETIPTEDVEISVRYMLTNY